MSIGVVSEMSNHFYTTKFVVSLCLEVLTISGADMVKSPQGPHLYCRHGAMKKWNKWAK